MSVHRRQILPPLGAALLLCLPLLVEAGGQEAPNGARSLIEKGFAAFTGTVQGGDHGAGDAAGAADIIASLFDLELFSARILAERWPGLSGPAREEFGRALAADMARYIGNFLGERGGADSLDMRFEALLTSGFLPSGQSIPSYLREAAMVSVKTPGLSIRARDHVMLRYALRGPGGRTSLYFMTAIYPGGTWKIAEIFSRGNGLVNEYRLQTRETLKKYSLPYLIAELGGSGRVVLEDWREGEAGGLPPGWRWRDSDNDRRKPYALREEDGKRFLAADDRGESVPLGKDVRWNPGKYPYLSFRWRVRRLPEGGDERRGETNDSAAGVTVVFDLRMGVVPKSIKYVWSSTLPVGSAVRREGVGRPWVVVADSGVEGLGEWREHVFNVAEAYRQTFGGEPPDATVGIGILTDANAVSSAASADYGRITALREAEAGSGIRSVPDAP